MKISPGTSEGTKVKAGYFSPWDSMNKLYANNPERTKWSGPGYYFGTEMDAKWWKRYRRSNMLARGRGKFRISQWSFGFERKYGSSFYIPILDIETITTTGHWHAGKWSKTPILKINWTNDSQKLSSGFLFFNDAQLKDLITFLKVYSCQEVTKEELDDYKLQPQTF